MKYLSVCSGIEAASVAWQPLGWQPAMFAEIDPFCCWLLHERYGASRPVCMPSPQDAPDTKDAKRRAAAIRSVAALPADGDVVNAGDFTKIGKSDVGTIDLLAGGTPCQSFSVAGKRAGLDDARGNLTIEFARLADRLRPTWLVWENVPGVLSIDGGRTFGAFLGLLVQLGYGVAYRVLDAQYFGVPQRRRRVFVVGYLGNWRAVAAVLFERHSLSGHPPPRREAWQEVAGSLGSSSAGGYRTDLDGHGAYIPEVVSQAMSSKWAKGSSGPSGDEVANLVASPLTASYGKQVDSSNTSNGPPNVLYNQMAVRRLTPRECERLQGFPDDYTLSEYRGKPAADGPRYRALGNSMAVPVMLWIGKRIAKVEALWR